MSLTGRPSPPAAPRLRRTSPQGKRTPPSRGRCRTQGQRWIHWLEVLPKRNFWGRVDWSLGLPTVGLRKARCSLRVRGVWHWSNQRAVKTPHGEGPASHPVPTIVPSRLDAGEGGSQRREHPTLPPFQRWLQTRRRKEKSYLEGRLCRDQWDSSCCLDTCDCGALDPRGSGTACGPGLSRRSGHGGAPVRPGN